MSPRNPSLVPLDTLQDSQLYDVYARRGLHGAHHGVLFKDGEAKNMPGVIVRNLRGRVNCIAFPPGTPVSWLPGGSAVLEDYKAPPPAPSGTAAMSTRKLKDLAKERGIVGYGGMRKSELLEALSE